VTVEDALFVVSCTLVAVTVNVPCVVPAVYSPDEEIVPPVDVHVTPVSVALATVAVNCFVVPVATDALVGEMVTWTPVELAITTVRIGRLAWVPTVLVILTISPGLLLTSMTPWFVAGVSIHDCT